jgi:hypothetical protein
VFERGLSRAYRRRASGYLPGELKSATVKNGAGGPDRASRPPEAGYAAGWRLYKASPVSRQEKSRPAKGGALLPILSLRNPLPFCNRYGATFAVEHSTGELPVGLLSIPPPEMTVLPHLSNSAARSEAKACSIAMRHRLLADVREVAHLIAHPAQWSCIPALVPRQELLGRNWL